MSTSLFSEDTRISVRLLMGITALIVIPGLGSVFHIIRALDGIGSQLELMNLRLTGLEEKTNVAISGSAFRAWLREARASGYENLPSFLTD